jgi:trimeric autotransporter adhesin
MSGAQISALLLASPIVLDLDGNGVSTSAAAQGVRFDLQGTGQASQVGWTAGGDGLLAIDLNGNGRIDNGTELFGTGTLLANGTRASNGYQAMAQYDTNGDGKLDAGDAQFAQLRVWVDANHDGVTGAGELKTLAQLGITSIDLGAEAGTTVQHGNLLGLTSTYTTTDGATHETADVWFAKDTGSSAATASTPALADLLAQPAGHLLPGADGAEPAKSHLDAMNAAAHALHGLHGWNGLLGDEEQRRGTPLL